MISNLKLKWNYLILYALIYWFSQDGESKYRWSLSYIQKALWISKNSVLNVLDELLKKELIFKETYKNWNKYYINSAKLGSAEIALGQCRNCTTGSAEIAQNNNIYNNNINNISIDKSIDKQAFDSDDKNNLLEIVEEEKKEKKDSAQKKEKKPDSEIDECLEIIKNNNGWICDGKKQRRYAKHLINKLKKIEKVEQGKWTWQEYLNWLINIVSKNKFHKHKVCWPDKLFYNLAEIQAIANEDYKNWNISGLKWNKNLVII